MIRLNEIKMPLGTTEIEVKVYPQITGKLKVVVKEA